MSALLTEAPAYSTLTSPEFDALAAKSLETILARQFASDAKWHRERFDQWSCDQEKGTLTFNNADGSGVVADVQILGSYAPDSESWEWGWNNPSVNTDIARDSQTAREFGEANGYAPLTNGILRVTPDESRLLIAVAAVTAGVEGVYWAQSGTYAIAMGYRNVRPLDNAGASGIARPSATAAPAPQARGFIGDLPHYFTDYAVLKRGGPKPLGGQHVIITTAEAAHIAPELLAFLTQCEETLVSRGFAQPLRVTNAISADIKSVVTLFEHPRDGAIGFILIGVGKYTGVQITASIRTDFADGIQMYTSNSRNVARTPSRKNLDNARFPDVTDVGVLYDIHVKRVAEKAKTAATVPLTRGADPIAYQDAETRDIQGFWVKKGYYRFVEGDKFQMTLLGAHLSAWRGLSPWKTITEGKANRKTAAIRQRLGV